MNLFPLDASLTLAEAAPKWLAGHQPYIQANTLRNYRLAICHLTASLGEVLLNHISIGHIRSYQMQRANKTVPSVVNAELSVMQMILRHAGEWGRLSEFYKPLRVPARGAGHSLTQEEEARLREVAFTEPKWRLAAHCMTIMISTTMGFGELRHLRRHDVNVNTKKPSIMVREGVKNRFRVRTIPLNEAAFESMTWILDRWKKLGGDSDEHYILPHRPRTPQGHWILSEPMGSIATAFTRIRIAADLRHFRLYDCRVQAITKLLSNPTVSTQVSKEIAGHISDAMQSRYSIQRFDTKKAALDALDNPSTKPVLLQPPGATGEQQPLEPTKPEVQKTVSGIASDVQALKPVQKLTEVEIAMRAEIDLLKAELARVAHFQFDLAAREHPPESSAPEKYARRKRRSKTPSGDYGDAVFCRSQASKNLISFPTRSIQNGGRA